MSNNINPGLVTSGLGFYYDMGNIGKSFIGAPATNLAYTGVTPGAESINTWTNSGAATLNTNETDVTKPSIPYDSKIPSNLNILSGLCTTSGSIHCGPIGITTVSASTTYTISTWFRQNRAGSTSPYMRTNVNNNSLGNFSYNGDTNSGNWPVNQWIRITCTGTTQSNENGVYLSNYLGTAGDKIWYYGYQVELGSIATAFTTGTRTNTQALYDLTNNNTITATSLTYASDGTFRFNGSSNYLVCTNNGLSHGNADFTYSCWASLADKPVYGTFFENGSWGTSLLIRFEMSCITVYSMNAGWGNFPWNPTLNTWHHLTFVRNGSNLYFYVDGVYNNSMAFTANVIPGTAYMYIGTSQHATSQAFNGKIATASVYTRSLSASEVKQNFNAHRGRFGI